MKFFIRACFVAFAVISALLIIQNPAFAQNDQFEPGYIITSAGDSVNGFIRVTDPYFNSKRCEFKEAPERETKMYSPNEIIAYGAATKKRYVAHTIKFSNYSEKVFISCLVKGKVSLFYFEERYFAESGNGLQELVTTTTNVTRDGKVFAQEMPIYKGVLQTVMNDCSTIHENLKSVALKKNDLTELFESYYKCIGQSATVYKWEGGKIKIALGIAVSGQSTSFDITSEGHPSYLYLDNNDAMTDFSVAPAFIIEFYAPEGTGKFRVRSGLSYFTGKYHVYDEGSNGTPDHELTVDMARIELPVMLKYYPLKKAGLYISAGLGFNVSVKWNQKSVTIQPPTTIISESSGLKNSGFFTNPMAGLGYDFLVGKRKIFIEGIYGSSRFVLSSSIDPVGRLNSITVTTGFVF